MRTLVRWLPAAVLAFGAWGVAGVPRDVAAAQRSEPDENKILLAGHWGARHVYAGCLLPNQAVLGATLARPGNTRLVTIGTVTTAQDGSAQYDAAPTDRLVWKRPGQKPAEFFITTLNGDFSDGGRNFFTSPYALKYRVVVEGEMDLEVESTKTATGAYTKRYQTRIKGSMAFEGKQYRIDLEWQGTSYFESSYGGFENRDDHTVTGTIKGPDFHLTVFETAHWEAVSFEGTTVTFDVRTLKNRVAAGGKTYQWEDVLLRKNFKNGQPNRVEDEWICRGRILVDGQPFATYGKGSMAGKIVYKIEAPGGAIELGRW
jgi:hypothetical protein